MPVAIFVKVIKPKRLDDKEMKRILRNAMKRQARAILKDFKKTTRTWNSQPEWTISTSIKPPGPSILIGTDNEIYGYLDEGTEDHYIAPVNAKVLRFQPSYTAKTTPGLISSKKGGPKGPFVYSMGHMVSGIKPRGWVDKLEKKWTPRYKREMEKAMRKAARASKNAVG